MKRRLRAAAQALRAELEELAKFRTDSTADDERAAANAIGAVKLAYYETYTELVTERLALETAGRAEAYMDRQFTRQINSVLGVDPMPTPALRSAALRFAQENVALIRSVEEEYFARLEADIVLALRQGARWEQLAPKISERYKVSGRRAELIARDQMGSLVSQVAQAKQQSAGFDKYIWRNSQDERVVGNPSGHYPQGNDRHGDHWSREGKVFSWSNPPHDGHPGEAINCRCTAEPYWGDEEAEEADESDLVLAPKVAAVLAETSTSLASVTAHFPSAETMFERAGRTPRRLSDGDSQRQFGTHIGRASGRAFNYDERGLDIEKRSIRGVQITAEGIATVEKHIDRFEHYEPNQRMLERLRKIQRGEIEITEYDARFYTHELREYERYSAVGWETGQPENADEAYSLWTTQHTATLEEYGINEDVYPLYHPEAKNE